MKSFFRVCASIASIVAALTMSGAAPVAASAPFITSRHASSAASDSAAVHKSLRKAIERFQDQWRGAWQKAELKRHRAINLTQIRGWTVTRTGAILEPYFDGDRAALNLTPELRRYLSILCFVGTPTDRQIEASKSRAKENIGTPFGRPSTQPVVRGARTAPLPDPASGSSTWATTRIIDDPTGAVCPSWTPDDEPLPLDEGEAIDLAIPMEARGVLRRDRESLIQQLEAAQAQFPKDPWIAGQLVRFVIDQGSPPRMLAAAHACGAAPSWCLRLLGLVHDQSGKTFAADSAYHAAELSARAETAPLPSCTDADLMRLLPTSDRAALAKLPCGDQRTLVERLWWLTDPLWSVAGNERRVAHESRRLLSSLRSTLDRDERYVWSARAGGTAQRELILRYGWPSYTYWPGGQFEEEMNTFRERDSRLWQVAPPYTAREYSRDRQSLLPAMRAVRDPFTAQSSDWQTSAPLGTSIDQWWPREHMMLWTQLSPLASGQHAQLRRDSAVMFALAVDDPLQNLDSAAAGPSVAWLMASTSPSSVHELAQAKVTKGETLRLKALVASDPLVLSAEVHARTHREPALRARFGVTPPPTLREMPPRAVALSDPVFMRLPASSASATTQVDSVLSWMAGGLTFARTERLAVYWEGYGFSAADTLDIQLHIARREESGGIRRVGERVGVVPDRRDSIAIAWREPDTRRGAALPTLVTHGTGRSIVLNLQQLPAGAYRIGIEMRRVDGASARSERLFWLRE